MQPGLFLVISPLIALMRDQVSNLRKRGITAYAIHTGMTRTDVINILSVAAQSNCKLLYVSPERLSTPLFQEYLPALNVRGLAVDEAHCISQWGYDFRPAYLRIAELREQLPEVPILALTASATPAIQEDIQIKLSRSENDIETWNLFRNSFERSNLSYSVLTVPNKMKRLATILERLDGTGIIYGRSRKGVEETAEQIAQWGISVAHYHAGLSPEERRSREIDWMNGKTRVMVCTNAFGMGIDKPDVRFVVHIDAPDSMENYYQEAGRAGRDGKMSYAILLSEPGNLTDLEEKGKLQFPSLDEVRKIYQSVANYLQMPVGAGAGEWYDFDLLDFRRKFKHPSYVLKQAFVLLEENQWLTYNEELFFPPQVQVLGGRDTADSYEAEAPREIELLRTLLRLYGGIRDQRTGISERALAKALKWDVAFIVILLNRLQKMGLIDYQPKKEKPQLQFLQPRASASEIGLDATRYSFRKQEAEKRRMALLQYLREGTTCRSRWIGNYFGDTDLKDCGICDNCLEQKKRTKSIDRIELHERILDLLNREPMNWMQVKEQLSEVPTEKLKESVEFLLGEETIRVDEAGIFRTKKS